MIFTFFSKLAKSLVEPAVTADSLAAHYASMTDAQLQRVDPKQLTSLARPIWQRELEARRKFAAKVRPAHEPAAR